MSNRLNLVYRPDIFELEPRANNADLSFLEQFIFFSLGRESLRNLVMEISKSKNSILKILLPEFICRDVFDAIRDLNVEITWYKIDLNDISQVNIEKQILETHDILIIVNFFGIAAHFEKESSYDKLIVIEDNAHGFLSEDSFGYKLGTRFDFGIFSLRKTLPITMGAGLYFSTEHSQMIKHLKNIQERKTFIDVGISKLKVRNLLSYIPLNIFRFLLKFKRSLNKASGQEFVSNNDGSVFFPKRLLLLLNTDKEKARRAKLYSYCKSFLEEMTPWIDIIPFKAREVPYGFVFILKDQSKLDKIRSIVEKKGGDLVNWPDLPEDVLMRYPGESLYKQVYFIPFNW